ncbi:MAG: PilZ domain-containing protein [Clostridia bacterium]|nr:PilZ domain-containing protein [Deltaproteobacteria bacterium]
MYTIFYNLRLSENTVDYMRAQGLRIFYVTSVEEVILTLREHGEGRIVIDASRTDVVTRLHAVLGAAEMQVPILVTARRPTRAIQHQARELGADKLYRWPNGVIQAMLESASESRERRIRATRALIRQKLVVGDEGHNGLLIELSATGCVLEAQMQLAGALMLSVLVGEDDPVPVRAEIVRTKQTAENVFLHTLRFVDVSSELSEAIEAFSLSQNIIDLTPRKAVRRTVKVRVTAVGATRQDYMIVNALSASEARLVRSTEFDPGWQVGTYVDMVVWRPSVGYRWSGQVVEVAENGNNEYTVRLASAERRCDEIRRVQAFSEGRELEPRTTRPGR